MPVFTDPPVRKRQSLILGILESMLRVAGKSPELLARIKSSHVPLEASVSEGPGVLLGRKGPLKMSKPRCVGEASDTEINQYLPIKVLCQTQVGDPLKFAEQALEFPGRFGSYETFGCSTRLELQFSITTIPVWPEAPLEKLFQVLGGEGPSG